MGDLQKLLQFFSSGYWYEVKLLRVGYTVTGCVTCQNTDGLDLTVVVLIAVGHGTCLAPLSVCTKGEQRSVVDILWAEGVEGVDIYTRSYAQYGVCAVYL